MMQSHSPYPIEIPRRSQTCAKGGEPLSKGQEYYSTLVEGDKIGSYVRQDYCLKCAEELLKDPSFKGFVSYWKSAIAPHKEPSDLIRQRDQQALILLKEAITSKDENSISEAFVLALYLARRRRIYLRHEMKTNDEACLMIYEVPESEEMICVKKINLSELQVEKVQAEIAKKFYPEPV